MPVVLFAYREATQGSLGFSPFELLYGCTVRGPMQILKELWVKDGEQPDTKTVYQYVLDLCEYKHIFTDKPGTTDLVQHEVTLTSSEPVRTKPYPIPFAMRDTVKKEVQTMLDPSVIEPSNSSYCSLMVIVKKKDSSNRCCLDFRQINRITLFDNQPMSHLEAIYAKLKGDIYFSKCDFSAGFWQTHMASKDKKKTAFVTPDGCFQFRKMPFRIVNSTATYTECRQFC